MKRFNITVNGKAYDVAVEEIGGSVPAMAAPVAAVTPVATPAPAAPVGAVSISAPMPGVILDVKVNVGDTVSKGQPVIVLEAMKMENDIVATADGKIAAVNVKKGDSVKTGDVLISIQ